ncbi:MAG: PAS domain-containing protein [Bacillota bacterium]
MNTQYKVLSETDKTILKSYQNIVEGLSDYLGEGFELVLHSLENLDQSVIKIMNGHYSGRSEGSPITNLALNMLSKFQENDGYNYLSYFNRNKKGVMLKSSTIAIEGENKRIIGFLCINFYYDTPVERLINNMIQTETSSSAVETFSDNAEELVLNALAEATAKVHNDASISNVNKNKEIVAYLYHKGIFNLKDAVVITANNLGISKNTVYLHIRGLSNKERP